jgi:hypothetical protein
MIELLEEIKKTFEGNAAQLREEIEFVDNLTLLCEDDDVQATQFELAEEARMKLESLSTLMIRIDLAISGIREDKNSMMSADEIIVNKEDSDEEL